MTSKEDPALQIFSLCVGLDLDTEPVEIFLKFIFVDLTFTVQSYTTT